MVGHATMHVHTCISLHMCVHNSSSIIRQEAGNLHSLVKMRFWLYLRVYQCVLYCTLVNSIIFSPINLQQLWLHSFHLVSHFGSALHTHTDVWVCIWRLILWVRQIILKSHLPPYTVQPLYKDIPLIRTPSRVPATR